MAGRITHKTRMDMARVAQCMADGCPSVIEASRRLHLTQSRTDQLWQRIRRELGVAQCR